VVELSSDVSLIVVSPPRQAVCSLPGQTGHNDVMYQQLQLPLQTFEMVNIGLHRPELQRPYCRASSMLDVNSCLAQQIHRQALTNDETSVASERLTVVSDLQTSLCDSWRGLRWLGDIIRYARSTGPGVTLQACRTALQEQSTTSGEKRLRAACSKSMIGRGLVDTPVRNKCRNSGVGLRHYSSQESLRSSDSLETSSIASTDSLERNIEAIIEETCSSDWLRSAQIYVALPCKLSPGTEYTMNVQYDTSAENAIDYLLRQVNNLQRSPVNLPSCSECYLVAVIGNRERILRERFPLRQLAAPWTSGRLYVRRRKDTLAALDMEQLIAECL